MNINQSALIILILIFNCIFNGNIDDKIGTRQLIQTIRVYSESYEFGEFGYKQDNLIKLINIGIKLDCNTHIQYEIILMIHDRNDITIIITLLLTKQWHQRLAILINN